MACPPLDSCCKPLTKCCCRLVEEQCCYCLRVDKHVRDLSRGLAQLEDKREDAEIKIQVAEERGNILTREARDCLRRVRTEEAAARTIQAAHAGLSTCLCFAPNGISAATNGRRAVELLPVLNYLLTELSTITHLTTSPPPPPVIRIGTDNLTEIMSTQICSVLGYLRDDVVGVVGICGPGGVGKTALLHCINDHFYTPPAPHADESIASPAPPVEATAPAPAPAGVDGEGDHLRVDYVIRLTVPPAHVSETEASLRRDIARRVHLTLQCDGANSSIDAQVISDFLSGWSFLLLLDGLHKRVDLSLIGIPRSSGIHRHKVVFTTRSLSLCGDMGAKATIRMRCLRPSAALALFQKNANISASDAEEPLWRRLIENVAGECSGLPQAIIDVGRAMSQTRSPHDWDRAWTILHKSNIEAINLSPFRLLNDSIYGYNSPGGGETAENKCFLFCSLWPGNNSINSEELVLSWFGFGLIDVLDYRDINEARDAGHQIVNKLKDECLLEPGESDQSQVRMLNPIRLNALRNLISEWSTTPNSWIVWSGLEMKRAPQEERRWVSAELVALVRSGVEELLPLSAACPNLHTLMLGGNPALKAVPPNFLRFMPCLEYLDLSDTGLEEVPPGIGTLGELRYLNLSRTYIPELPRAIGKLVNLRYLLLHGTSHLRTIHREARSILQQLWMLDLTESGYAYHWTERDASDAGGESIAELRNIRSSTALGLSIASLPSHGQRLSLPSVPIWRLSIMNLEGLHSRDLQLLSPDFLGMPDIRSNLREFTMKHSRSLEALDMGAGELTGDSMPKLEILRLLSLSSLESISWTRRAAVGASPFPSLRQLTISYCDKLPEATWVAKLRWLEHLELSHCSQMTAVLDVPNERDPDGDQCPLFGRLQTLVLEGLPELTSVCNQRLGFASLECLRLSGCPRLDRLPFRTEMSGAGKMQMIKGERVWWENLQWAPEDSCIKVYLQTLFDPIPNVPPLPRHALPYIAGAHEPQVDPQPVGIRKIMVSLTSFYRALFLWVRIAPLALLIFFRTYFLLGVLDH